LVLQDHLNRDRGSKQATIKKKAKKTATKKRGK